MIIPIIDIESIEDGISKFINMMNKQYTLNLGQIDKDVIRTIILMVQENLAEQQITIDDLSRDRRLPIKLDDFNYLCSKNNILEAEKVRKILNQLIGVRFLAFEIEDYNPETKGIKLSEDTLLINWYDWVPRIEENNISYIVKMKIKKD